MTAGSYQPGMEQEATTASGTDAAGAPPRPNTTRGPVPQSTPAIDVACSTHPHPGGPGRGSAGGGGARRPPRARGPGGERRGSGEAPDPDRTPQQPRPPPQPFTPPPAGR